MNPRITILDDYQNVALEIADWSSLSGRFDLDVVTEHIADESALVDRLHGSEVVVAMRERTAFPASVLDRLPNLKLLVTTGPFNPSFDLQAAASNGVTVSGTRYPGNALVEQTIGIMIALTRNFAVEARSVQDGGWQTTIGPGLQGHTLGLVGMGRFGGRVARVAQALEMDVVAWSPNLTQERADEYGVRAVTKAELFGTSDIVSVHMVLSASTMGLIGEDDLRAMKPSAYFINTSRGPIVNEEALVSIMTDRAIAGVGLDVYDIEPLPVDHPFRRLPNSLVLPHIGYVTKDAYEVFYADAVEDILAYYDGAPLRVVGER
jgi:phosphoglycerate dehydrogenase-like enzyme